MRYAGSCVSLPARERGLKPRPPVSDAEAARSLPARERGLKRVRDAHGVRRGQSLPARERGLKPEGKLGLYEAWDGRSPRGSVD